MSDVPCNGCTACCRAFSIWIEPGEQAAHLKTVPVLGQQNRRMLARQEDGACYYLRDGACTIYDFRPRGCRKFDCREWVKKFPDRAARKSAERSNPAVVPVIARGRELSGTEVV